LKSQTRWILNILCGLVGISCWTTLYGLWVQTPILVEQLPEKGTLPSYMILLIEIANVAPIVYGIFRKRLKVR
jgi:PREDICTED: G protein-coupled receptor 172A-like